MTSIQLAFEINATCHQQLHVLDKDYTEDTIIAGLQDGTLVTTTWHDGRNTRATIDETETGREIAEILSQEIDGEYFDFR